MKKVLPNLVFIFFIVLFSCHKKDHLNTKPTSNILVPTSAEDLQGLLDNPTIFGYGPYLNTILADEFYYTDAYLSRLLSEAKAYTWQDKLFDENENVPDWNDTYTQIYYCNLAIEGIKKGLSNNMSEKQLAAIKADALFKRSIAFYNLAQLFARPYDSSTAKTDLGIPLRLTSDSKEKLSRGSLQTTYEQILSDISSAIPLLPTTLDLKFRNRGSQPAAWALLARIYLNMRDYQHAAVCSEACLNLYDSLIDFNGININNLFPFTSTNKETLYQCKMAGRNFTPALWYGMALIDTNLISLYQPGDLRQHIFFHKSVPNIKGSYSGEIFPFNGLALDEVYLTLAESYIKLGQVGKGLNILNKLLVTRWKKGEFIPYEDTSMDKAWRNILTERQKELVFRGIRWSDIRRLNKEGLKIDLTRKIGGTQYKLAHYEYDRFVLLLPDNVIRYGYTQN